MKVQNREQILGWPVRGSDGRRLGRVHAVKCAPDRYTLAWLLIRRGAWRRDLRAVPATRVEVDDSGALQVPYRHDQVAHAPELPAKTPIDPATWTEIESFYAATATASAG